MTQENAADRAQNFNEFDETTDAVESFAQDWLAAEGLENGEPPVVAKTPRVVATLPDWSTFVDAPVGRREGWDWRRFLRDGKTKTTGVALAAFGLGVLCAPGGWRNEENGADAPAVAAVGVEKSADNELPFESTGGETETAAFATIDSSTLRSVPNVAGVGLETQAPVASGNGAVAGVWEKNNELAENSGWADLNGQAAPGAANEGNAAPGAAAEDSHWRRGVDFERGTETVAETTASSDRFPTWGDLETGVNAPSVEDILNSPVGGAGAVAANAPFAPGTTVASAAPVASDYPVASTAPVASGYQVASTTPVASDYPVASASSVASGYPVASVAPVASGYPVASAAPVASGYPVASAAPVASDYPVASAAPVASGYPVASTAPVASGYPVATNGANGESVANNNYPSGNNGTTLNSNSFGVPNAGASAGYTAYNDGAGRQENNGANLTGAAPQFAGNSQNSGYNQANGSENFAGWPTATPNFAPTPNLTAANAPTAAEPPRAMVAQAPSESGAVATPSVPATNPNLRW